MAEAKTKSRPPPAKGKRPPKESKRSIAVRKRDAAVARATTPLERLPQDIAPVTPGTLASAFAAYPLDDIIECLRNACEDDPRLPRILAAWEALDPPHQVALNVWDRLCPQFQLAPDKFLGLIAAASLRINRSKSLMLIASREADVVRAVADRATGELDSRDGGTADALNFMKASGLIREGGGVNVKVGVGVQVSQAQGERGLPEFHEESVKAVGAVREERKKLLAANTSIESAQVIDAEWEAVPR